MGRYEGKKVCVPHMGLSFMALYSRLHFSLEEVIFGFVCLGGSASSPPPPLDKPNPGGEVLDVADVVFVQFCWLHGLNEFQEVNPDGWVQ